MILHWQILILSNPIINNWVLCDSNTAQTWAMQERCIKASLGTCFYIGNIRSALCMHHNFDLNWKGNKPTHKPIRKLSWSESITQPASWPASTYLLWPGCLVRLIHESIANEGILHVCWFHLAPISEWLLAKGEAKRGLESSSLLV